MGNQLKKPTVTIGISAHNEERNIGSVLSSLKTQTQSSYFLDSVVVLCDGCTDKTSDVVKSFIDGDFRLRLIDDGDRVGKIGRVNWLCSNTDTDILVILDADIRIADVNTIEKIVSEFNSDEVGLVAGLQIPEAPRNFSENIFVTLENIWIETRKDINDGVSVHNISGCNFAMSKKLYSKLIIPREVVAEDEFMFFAAEKAGLRFVFTPKVNVYYRLPNNFHDYFLQSSRFMTTKYRIFEYFGESLEDAYVVPFSNKIMALTRVFIKKPILTLISIFLHVIIKVFIRFHSVTYNNGMYRQAMSTK